MLLFTGHRKALAALLFAVASFSMSIHSPAQESSESSRKVVNRVVPPYPSIARNMSLKGNVKVEAIVAPNGIVKSVEIKGGHPILAQSAQNAIRQWKWESAPKETRELIEVRFSPN